MHKITVNTSSSYDVIIDSDFIADFGKLIAEKIEPCKAAIITDDAVDVLYGHEIEKSLAEAGFECCKIVVPHGESGKNIENLAAIWEQLAENQLSRSDIIVAVGGGVIGDMAGFAAATYLRGIRFVQIPTTLLAAIDSSVGGKTAIDLKAGKNLAGAFWQPEMVLCDIGCLRTLPLGFWLDGMGEMIKYAFAFDGSIIDMINDSPNAENCEELIARCVDIKRKVVEADERDNGERRKLNFGHTIGHAIEQCSDFTISHGQAVGIGMVIMTRACVKRGLVRPEVLDKLMETMAHCKMPTKCEYSAKQLAAVALGDKKRRGKDIFVVIPTAIGESAMKRVAVSELEDWIAMGL